MLAEQSQLIWDLGWFSSNGFNMLYFSTLTPCFTPLLRSSNGSCIPSSTCLCFFTSSLTTQVFRVSTSQIPLFFYIHIYNRLRWFSHGVKNMHTHIHTHTHTQKHNYTHMHMHSFSKCRPFSLRLNKVWSKISFFYFSIWPGSEHRSDRDAYSFPLSAGE